LLEAEYQNALADVGLGHEGLKELEEYEAWKKEQRRLQEEVAGEEGFYHFKKIQICKNQFDRIYHLMMFIM